MSKQNKKTFWKSLDELNQTQEFTESLNKEFPNPPEKQSITAMERRTFLKVMGAGMLMASLASCRRPVEKIIPYVNRPDDVTPGLPNYYASTCGECSVGCGLLVKTRESRPVKLEGNDLSPLNEGALCARGQASILNLYYPGRLAAPVKKVNGENQKIDWLTVDKEISSKLAQIGSKKVYLFSKVIGSPSTLSLINDFSKKFRNFQHVSYDPLVPEEVIEANESSFGVREIPSFSFEKAKVVVSFGADFLGTWVSPVEFSKGFSKTRDPETKSMSKLYVYESNVSLTGTNADISVPVKSGDEYLVALSLAHELIIKKGLSSYADNASIKEYLAKYSVAKVSQITGLDLRSIPDLANELWVRRGESIVLGGAVKANQGVALQVVVNLINSALGNYGKTIATKGSYESLSASSYVDVLHMIEEMKNGQVGAIFIYGTNPSYILPEKLGFNQALEKVDLKLSFATMLDETSLKCDYILPDSHYLESWNDHEPYQGYYSITQPVVAPIFDTRSFQESLIKWGKLNVNDWHAYLKSNWRSKINNPTFGFNKFWDQVLEKGFYDANLNKNHRAKINGSIFPKALSILNAVTPIIGKYTLSLYPSIAIADGQMAGNAWLQELPDPISKVTWDNYVAVSPQTAKELAIDEGDIVEIEGKGIKLEAPAHIQPKLHQQSLSIAIGYGRSKVGEVDTAYAGHDFGVIGEGLGINAYPLQKINNKEIIWSGIAIDRVVKTGKRYRLAITQGHHHIEGRDIVRETTLMDYLKDPASGSHSHHQVKPMSLWSGHDYNGYKWGMSVDTSKCTGCGSCMIGCQAENNVPVVGKEQILMGRDMHWLRVDRYYQGDDAKNPDVIYQPMFCQQCENAPCETVCPVLATVHSEDGLNQMIYNRCVGTRYCANNCPYKVRRFNYFEYAGVYEKQPLNYVLNPDVTVRSQGVMEKCTFCVQRIRLAKDTAKDRGADKVPDGELKTACQQTCPTDAIIFGDLNDSNSRVAKNSKLERSYEVLEELNVRSRVSYLTKVRNKV